MGSRNSPSQGLPYRLITHISDTSVDRDQESSLNLIDHELDYSVFEDTGLLDYLCPGITDDQIDKVIAQLDVQSLPWRTNPPLWRRGDQWLEWNIGRGQEKDAYAPLVWFQNEIISAISTAGVRPEDNCIFGNAQFYIWDECIEGQEQSLANKDGLKPDVFIHNGRPRISLSWSDIHLVEEVKTSWADMIRQISTYNRCIFAAHENWTCVPSLIFNQVSGSFRFGFQNRTGLVLTSTMSISKEQEFRQLIKAFIYLMNWTPTRALVDRSRSQRRFSFAQLGEYWAEEILGYRTNLIGTCSRVFALTAQRPREPGSTPGNVVLPPLAGCATFPHDDNESEALEPIHLPGLPSDYQERHDYLIYKLSWLTDNRSTEGVMFKGVRDEWGVPYVLDAFEVEDGDGRVIETRLLCSEQARFWDILLSEEERQALFQSKQTPAYVNRKLFGVLMKTVGKPLTDAQTLAEMLQGILHGMLGHYALYSSGWLHRDVSTGNVLLLKTPEDREQKRIESILPANASLGKCTGMIIDGDHAIKWNDEDLEISAESRTGTLPFLSMRLISTWDNHSDVVHTAADDLESFLWVLLMSVLRKGLDRPSGATKYEQKLYDRLQSTTLITLLHAKLCFLDDIQDGRGVHDLAFSPALCALVPLFRKWFSLGKRYKKELTILWRSDAVIGAYDALCIKAYKEYLKAGFKALAAIEKSKIPPAW